MTGTAPALIGPEGKQGGWLPGRSRGASRMLVRPEGAWVPRRRRACSSYGWCSSPARHHVRCRPAPILLCRIFPSRESNFPRGMGQEQAPAQAGPHGHGSGCVFQSCPVPRSPSLAAACSLCLPGDTCPAGPQPGPLHKHTRNGPRSVSSNLLYVKYVLGSEYTPS